MEGIVKEHYAIIHTTRNAPEPKPDEMPQRTQGSNSEAGMLPYPIRVRPRRAGDEGYALDRMSRLSFAQIESFDYGVKVKLLGRVHESSLQHFQYQFRLVWQGSQPAIPERHDPPSSTSPESPNPRLAVSIAPARSPTANTQTPAGMSISHGRTDSGIAFEGPVSVDAVT